MKYQLFGINSFKIDFLEYPWTLADCVFTISGDNMNLFINNKFSNINLGMHVNKVG
jgi:hypothetical protein